jgi:hypothetical protein
MNIKGTRRGLILRDCGSAEAWVAVCFTELKPFRLQLYRPFC